MSEIQQLRDQIAALQQRIETLEPKPDPAEIARAERREREGEEERQRRDLIISLGHTRTQMPNDAETKSLLRIVRAKYPNFGKPDGDGEFRHPRGMFFDDFVSRFRVAFCWIGTLGRAKEPDEKRAISWWAGLGNGWCRSWQLPRLDGDDFVAAALAWGDVACRPPVPSEGAVHWEIGLEPYDTSTLPAPDAWRRVLSGGLRPALPPRIFPSYVFGRVVHAY